MDTTTVISLISLVINVILVIYFLFFKSYLSQKGKNLATKQDIAEIRQITQRIDSEFNVYTQSKVSMVAEERNALIDWYEKICSFIQILYDINITTPFSFNEEYDYDCLTSQLAEEYGKLELSYSKMILFTQDLNVLSDSDNLRKFVLDLKSEVEKKIFQIANLRLDIDSKKSEKQADLDSIIKDYFVKIAAISDELATLRKDSLEYITLQKELISSIRARFASLANTD